MSGTNTNNDVNIDEAIRLKTAELAKLLGKKEQAARAHSYENSVRKIPYIIEQAVAVHNERMNADLNRSDLSPDEKRERQEAWARMANFIKESFTNGIPTLEQQEQWEAELASAEAVVAARAARAAGFIFGTNQDIIDNMIRLRNMMASPGIVNENVTAFIKPMIATLKRDDLSSEVKQMLKKEWVQLFNDYNEDLTNAIRTSEQEESAGIAEKRAATVAAIADIEKADKAVVGRTAAATTTAKVLSTKATAMTTTTADQPAAVLLPNRSGSAGSVIPSSEDDVDGNDADDDEDDEDDDNNDYQASIAAIDKEVNALLTSRSEIKKAQLKKEEQEKFKNVRAECDTIRSQLKTKNNEAAALQKQNAELRLEIDQKNQTIDALEAKVASHATKIKGHDTIP